MYVYYEFELIVYTCLSTTSFFIGFCEVFMYKSEKKTSNNSKLVMYFLIWIFIIRHVKSHFFHYNSEMLLDDDTVI